MEENAVARRSRPDDDKCAGFRHAMVDKYFRFWVNQTGDLQDWGKI